MAATKKTTTIYDEVVGDLIAAFKTLHHSVVKRSAQLAILHQHILDKTFPRDLAFKLGAPQLPASYPTALAKELVDAESAHLLHAKNAIVADRARCHQRFVDQLKGDLAAYDDPKFLLDLVLARLPVLRDNLEDAKEIRYSLTVLISNFRQTLKAQEAPTASAGQPMELIASTDTAAVATQLALVLKTMESMQSQINSLGKQKRLPHATSASAAPAPQRSGNPDRRNKSPSAPTRKQARKDTADHATGKSNRKPQQK
jgi:hypothetical protein